MNKILPLVINIPEDEFILSLDKSMNVLNPENKQKVLFESLSLSAFEEYIIQSSKKLKLTSHLPASFNNDELTTFRRELFPLNYINCNGYFINVLNISSLFQKELPIEINIFESESAADFYVPAYVDYATKQVYFLGYFTKEQINRYSSMFSESLYKIDIKHLENLENLQNELKEVKIFETKIDQESTILDDLKDSIGNLYDKLSLFEIPENFIFDVEYLPSSIYNKLLRSDFYSNLYLRSQLIFQKIMSSETFEKLTLLTSNLLILYQKNDSDIKVFSQKLKGIYNSFKISDEDLINDTLEQIQQSNQSLTNIKDYKLSDGKIHWFADQLKQSINSFSSDEVSGLLKSIGTSLSDITNKFLESKESESNNVNYNFEKDKFKIVQNFIGSIETNTMIGLFQFKDFKFSVDFEIPKIEVIKDFFQSELSNHNSKDIKKLLTFILLIIKEKGLLKNLTNKNSQQITLIVDLGLTLAKLIYKISQGELKIKEALKYYIERYQAIFFTIIKDTVKTYGTKSIENIVSSISEVFSSNGAATNILLSGVLSEIFIQHSDNFITEEYFYQVTQNLVLTIKNSELIQTLIIDNNLNILEKNINTELLE